MTTQIEKSEIVKSKEELGRDFIYKISGFAFDAAKIYQDYINLTDKLGIQRSKFGQLNLHVRGSAIEEGQTPTQLLLDFSGSLSGVKNKIRTVREHEFDTIHPSLDGTYTKEVIEQVMKYSYARVGRVRFLLLNPKTCYSMHRDPDWYRLHIPLKTNEKSFFIVDEKFFTMPEVGSLYAIHPQDPHLAANSDLHEDRLHLVFDTAEEIEIF